jgi:hypothetical protein
MKLPVAVLFVSMVALVSACASTPQRAASPTGQVGVSEVDSAVPTETRMTLAQNQTFQAPLPLTGNATPDYPVELLAQRLPPQALCLRVSIDEQGAVSDTVPVATGPDCPEIERVAPAFFEAAQAAASSWRFDPAFRCIYPEGTTPDPQGGCWGEGVREEAQAVSLAYRFVFEQVGGKGTVRLGE